MPEKNRPQHGGMLRPSFFGRHGAMASGSTQTRFIDSDGSGPTSRNQISIREILVTEQY